MNVTGDQKKGTLTWCWNDGTIHVRADRGLYGLGTTLKEQWFWFSFMTATFWLMSLKTSHPSSRRAAKPLPDFVVFTGPAETHCLGLFLFLLLRKHDWSPLHLAYPCFETHQTHPILHKLWAGVEKSEALAVVGLCCYCTVLLTWRCRSWFVLSSCWFGAVVTFIRNSHISDCRCCRSPYKLHLLFLLRVWVRGPLWMWGIWYMRFYTDQGFGLESH